MNNPLSCCQLLSRIVASCCQLLLARVNTKCISPFSLSASNVFTLRARKQHLAATETIPTLRTRWTAGAYAGIRDDHARDYVREMR